MWKQLFDAPWPDQHDLPEIVRQQAEQRIRAYWTWLVAPLIIAEVLLWATANLRAIPFATAYAVPPLLISMALVLGWLPRPRALLLMGMVGLFALHGILIKGLGGVTAISFVLPYTLASLTLAGRQRVIVQLCCVVFFWFNLFYEVVGQVPGLRPPSYILVSYNILLATMIFQGLRFLSRLAIELNTNYAADEVTRRSQQFLARVSHELRTPLNSVLGFAKMLRRGQNFTEPQQQYLQQIVEEGEQLNRLVSDLLDSAQLASGKLTLHPAPCDVNTICLAVTQELRTLVKPTVTMSTSFAADLPTATADPLRLRQIVRNLLVNAIKYTPAGRIEIATALRRNQLEISVSDTGPGIPEDQQALVFVPFVKLDKRSAGVGLGLDICMQLARLHGGTIRLVSAVGQGSTFTLELPLHTNTETDKQP